MDKVAAGLPVVEGRIQGGRGHLPQQALHRLILAEEASPQGRGALDLHAVGQARPCRKPRWLDRALGPQCVLGFFNVFVVIAVQRVRSLLARCVRGHVQQLLEGECLPRVPLLVVELEVAIRVLAAGRDAVVLGHADAPTEDVAGRGAGLHGEGPRVDDGQASVGGDVGPRPEALDAVDALGEVAGLLRGHCELEGELGVAEEEIRLRPAPGLELRLGLLDEDVQRVLVLLDEPEEVHKLPAHLGRGAVLDKVALPDGLLVGRGEHEGHVHVEVVGVLDAAYELLQLIPEVLAALLRHHEVVLEDDGETLPDDVARERALALGERAGRGLVRHAAGHALVEGPHVPFELAVGVRQVLVGQDLGGERAVGRVRDQPVDAIGEPRVGPLEGVWQVPAAVALVSLQVRLNVARGGPEHVLVIGNGGLCGL